MHIVSVIALIFGALIGLFMAVEHFRGKESPTAMGLVHGALTVSGIVLLVAGLLYAPNLDAWPALWALLATATGGLYLFYRQQTGKKWPSAVVLIHGGAAIASIAFLISLLVANGNGASRQAEPGVPAVTSGADGGN
ncbi:MAG TPA: hypothetical protein VF576_00035 [Rubricoccaceae bacterium]|jgi:hypothetical protein